MTRSAEDNALRQDLLHGLRQFGLVAQPDKSRAAHFRAFGLRPEVVFDVGVAKGTPQLYRAFPEAHFVLIDPQENSAAAMTGRNAPQKASFHQVALGSAKGRMELSVPVTSKGLVRGRASLNQPCGPMAKGITGFERQMVDVTTLDDLAADYPGVAGLKIDTEGHEAEVLAGAEQTLKRCEFVLLELSLTRRFDRAPRPSEIFAMLARAGLEFRDVLRSTGDGAGGAAPRLFDALFTRWPSSDAPGEGV